MDFNTFLWFGWWSEGACGPGIIENTKTSMHDRALGGRVDGLGGPKVIENLQIFMHFDGSGGGLGARAAPESLKIYTFSFMFVTWLEMWAAWRSQNH